MPTTIHITDRGNQTISGVKTFAETLSVRTISGISGSTLININAINNAQEIFGGNYLGGGINLTAGSGNFAGGSINLYAGPKVGIPYHGNIGVFGNVDINNDNSSIKNVVIYKTGVGARELNVWVQQNSVNVNNLLTVSGNPVLTGLSTLYATSASLDNKISSLSGVSVLTFSSQNISGTKTFLSSSIFNSNITVRNNLTVSGNSNISGILNVNGNSNVNGTSNVSGTFNNNGNATFRSGVTVLGDLRVTGNITNQGVVLTRNAQTISGVKTFLDKVLLNTFTTAGYAISNDDYRLNIAGRPGEDAGIQLDSYGVGGTSQILARTARGTATNLSGLLKDDIIFNFAAKGYVSGLNDYSQNSRAAIRYVTDEDWVSRENYTGQGTYIAIRTTNIGSPAAIDKVVISTSGLNVLDGDILISGYPVVNTTSDQTISGSKTFNNTITIRTISGTNSSSDSLNLIAANNTESFSAPGNINLTAGTGVSFPKYGSINLKGNISINNASFGDPTLASRTINIYKTGTFFGAPVGIAGLTIDNDNISLNDPGVNGSAGFGLYISGVGVTPALYATRSNLASTGSILDNKINSLSGVSVLTFGNQTISGIKTFDSRPTVNGTGVLLIGEASAITLPTTIVYTTGNQLISGNKTFINNVNISGTGSFNNVKVSSIDNLFLSGIDMVVTGNSSINVHNAIYISGNAVLTGVTGVLLAGQNTFTVFMQATNSNPANDSISYFNNIPGGPSSVIANKMFQIGEKCIAKKAAWNQYLDTFTGVPNQNATGYFINVSTRSTGVISTVINANTFGTSGFSYVSAITPNIAVNETDYVVCGLKWGNYTVGLRPSGWRAAVNIYCYN